MAEGLPLPWPFPWSVPPASSRMDLMAKSALSASTTAAAPFVDSVEAQARALRDSFGAPLPAVSHRELYVIEAVSEVDPPGSATGAKALAVIYPPEFLFVLDVGLECKVGGTVAWDPVGYGDPGFPEKKRIELRSIRGSTQGDLIFPKIAGSFMIGIREGASESEVREGLTEQGIRDIEFHTFFATGSCRPFEEKTICTKLEASLPFVKYAESNGIVRLVDFSPGWSAKRLL